MKIEVRRLETESPFRHICWAVLREGRVAAYCMTSEVAEALRVMLCLMGDDRNNPVNIERNQLTGKTK